MPFSRVPPKGIDLRVEAQADGECDRVFDSDSNNLGAIAKVAHATRSRIFSKWVLTNANYVHTHLGEMVTHNKGAIALGDIPNESSLKKQPCLHQKDRAIALIKLRSSF